MDVARVLIDSVDFDPLDRGHLEILDAIIDSGCAGTTRGRFIVSAIRNTASDRLYQWKHA